jgi:hypothetical protein
LVSPFRLPANAIKVLINNLRQSGFTASLAAGSALPSGNASLVSAVRLAVNRTTVGLWVLLLCVPTVAARTPSSVGGLLIDE